MLVKDKMASSQIPHIHLLAHQKEAANVFANNIATQKLYDKVSYALHEVSLSGLERNVRFDLVVSPANSYGILDGGFDDAISRAWSPVDDYGALTRSVQKQMYDHCRGYLPPGQCFIAKIPQEFSKKSRYGTDWGCKYIAMCPTMRIPQDVTWDREVVYEAVWSLLNAIDQHNRTVTKSEEKIRSILMTPLATATGGVSVGKWAQQAVLAMKHFIDAKHRPEHWGSMNWHAVRDVNRDITQLDNFPGALLQ